MGRKGRTKGKLESSSVERREQNKNEEEDEYEGNGRRKLRGQEVGRFVCWLVA